MNFLQGLTKKWEKYRIVFSFGFVYKNYAVLCPGFILQQIWLNQRNGLLIANGVESAGMAVNSYGTQPIHFGETG